MAELGLRIPAYVPRSFPAAPGYRGETTKKVGDGGVRSAFSSAAGVEEGEGASRPTEMPV